METCFNTDLNNINVASSILEASNSDSHEILTIYPDLDTLVSIASSSNKEKGDYDYQGEIPLKEKHPVVHSYDCESDEQNKLETGSNTHENENETNFTLEGSSSLYDVDVKLKCDVCHCSFTDELKYNAHLLKHEQSLYVDCNYCGKKIAYNRFVYHVMVHTGEKPHVCEVCGKGFRLKRDLRQHSFTHTGERPYQCDLCGKKFADTSSRRKHFQIHTGEKPYSCEICHKSFTQISHLREHQVTHTKEKSHTCELCLKKFTTKSSMQRHMLTHDNTCEVCNQTFTTNNKLQKHRELHDTERPFQCPICLRRFRKRTDINTHMLIHSDEKNVICTLCNEAFKSYRYLRVHYAGYHKGVGPPFRCNICFKGFFQDKSIKRHYAAHLSDSNKRAKCANCSITFSCTESLKKHSSLRNCDFLNCFECDTQFSCKSELAEHLNSIHNFFSDNLITPDIKKDSIKSKANVSQCSNVKKGKLSSIGETSNSSVEDLKPVMENGKVELNNSISHKPKNKLSPANVSKKRKNRQLPTIVKVEVVSDESNTSFTDHDNNSCSLDKYLFKQNY